MLRLAARRFKSPSKRPEIFSRVLKRAIRMAGRHFYEFGPFRLDPARRLLSRQGEAIPLTSKVLDTLLVLVENRGRVVAKEELMKAVWPDTFVEEGNLTQNISTLRKVLGESPIEHAYIETIPKRGYRFVASVTETAAGPWLNRRQALLWAVGLLVVLVIAGGALLFLRRGTKSPAAALTVVPLTSYPGHECCPSFSPDGSQVAFAWSGEKQDNYDIYIQVIGSGRPLRLTNHPALEWSPAWSPNGRYIAFLRFVPGSVSIVLISPLPGGSEHVLGVADVPPDESLSAAAHQLLSFTTDERRPAGSLLAWTPDSRWLVCPDRSPGEEGWRMSLLSVETGEKRRLTTPPKSMSDIWPALSPDGGVLVFVRAPTAVVFKSELYWLALSGDLRAKGEPNRLTFEEQLTMTPAWTADGRELIYSSGQASSDRSLWRIAARSLVSGGPRGPGKPERLSVAGEKVHSPAVSGLRRSLVYSQDLTDWNIWHADLTGALQASGSRPLVASTRTDRNPWFSPDGKRIVFVSDRAGRNDIWVCDRDGLGAEQLTSMNAATGGCPRWSPDGERIIFDSQAEGRNHVYVISAKGGRPQRLTSDSADDALGSWSRDGRFVYFASNRTGRWQVWKMPAGGGRAAQITRNGGAIALESCDGKFVYYTREPLGPRSTLFRVPVDGGEEIKILDALHPRSFMVVEKGIYFSSPRDQAPYSIQFFEFASRQTKPVIVSEKIMRTPAVSPDGRSMLYTQSSQEGSDLMLVENFR